MLQKLNKLLGIAEIVLSEKQKQQLINYVELLDKWNKTYNLTAIRLPDQMLVKHILDSLVVGKYLYGQRFIDVGTGAGLPGIPLAIMQPEYYFTLLDSLGKRTRFLKQVIFELEIKNVQLIQSRVEHFTPDDLFDGVLSRGFSSLEEMVIQCQHLPKPVTGRFYALKGILSQAELSKLPRQFIIESIHTLAVPELNEERHLVILTNAENRNNSTVD